MTRKSKVRPPFASEADLAKVVIAWLRDAGWTIFQEVEHHGDIADIVATRAGKVAVVECKLHLNPEVLHQADRWLTRAHFAWAAAPERRSTSDAWRFAQTACRKLGIGLLGVESHERWRDVTTAGSPTRFETYVETAVLVRVDAAEQKVDGVKLLATLRPEHETYAEAGSPTGHRWTPFRETERDVVAYVKTHPGELARDVLRVVPHHWRSKAPAGTLLALIRRGIITGIRAENGKGGARLFPVAPIVEALPAPAPQPVPTPAPLSPPTRKRSRVWQKGTPS